MDYGDVGFENTHVCFVFLPISDPQRIFIRHRHILHRRWDGVSIKVDPFWTQFLDGGLNTKRRKEEKD